MSSLQPPPIGVPMFDPRGGMAKVWARWLERLYSNAGGATGITPVTAGGTGLAAGTSGGILGFTGTTTLASSALLAAGALVLGGGAGATPSTLVGLGSSVQTLHGNASGAPTWGAVALTTDVSGTLPAANGGTGLSAYTAGDLLYASGATALSKLADVATGNALISGGVGVAPAWGKVDLTAHVSGILPVANGGTGIASGNSGGVLGYTAAGTIASSAALAANAVVIGGGAGATPTTISAGTNNQFLKGSTGAAPAFGTATLASADFANQGTTTTVLHGNAVGNPSWGAVSLTADVAGILPSANGGTGNGFAKFDGPTTAEKTFTLPDANATLLYSGGALGTPSSGVATNLTGTAAGLTAGTASAVAVGGITGLGTGVATALAVNVGSAGAAVVNGGALGTPSSGTLTNCDGYPAASDTASGIIEIAIQSEMETGTDTGRAVVPGRQHFHPSAAKAWLKCDAAGAIQASHNVTSITDTGTGLLSVTWNTDFSSADYSVVATALSGSQHFVSANSMAAGTCAFICWRSDTAGLVDPTNYLIAAWGDQ